ncbi:MAG: sulfurtransferase [Deltaproteobacteria bacterium]|nr:sulfurtransferase [Deltaproteobacteria bacterium]
MAKNLGAANIVVIDTRTVTNYGVGHLPGAVSMPYKEWAPFNQKRDCNLMPTPAAFTKKMRALGVNSGTHVIIYDQGNTTGDSTRGTSTVGILETMGHDNVSYLDGGFTKWTFEGRIIDNKKPVVKAGNFSARLDSSRVASLQDVEANIKSHAAVFVDARNSNQFFGNTKRADVDRFGHIPGALNLPAPFLNDSGVNRAPAVIMSKKALETMVKGVGLPQNKNKKLIVYCNTGQFAGMDYFVLHGLLGYKNVAIYDGSMLEYASHDKLPLVRFAWGRVSR